MQGMERYVERVVREQANDPERWMVPHASAAWLRILVPLWDALPGGDALSRGVDDALSASDEVTLEQCDAWWRAVREHVRSQGHVPDVVDAVCVAWLRVVVTDACARVRTGAPGSLEASEMAMTERRRVRDAMAGAWWGAWWTHVIGAPIAAWGQAHAEDAEAEESEAVLHSVPYGWRHVVWPQLKEAWGEAVLTPST
jgi:hypothetical protein